jgi:uncharacterized membrane protein
VVVEPGHRTLSSGVDGAFELELPPGRYEVTIEAKGFGTYHRSVTVEANGVLVVNADLQK